MSAKQCAWCLGRGCAICAPTPVLAPSTPDAVKYWYRNRKAAAERFRRNIERWPDR